MMNYSAEAVGCSDYCIENMVGFVLEGIIILIIAIFGIIGEDIHCIPQECPITPNV